jgi:aspartate beta-hydroxylase
MPGQVAQLIQAANQLAQSGRMAEAERVWVEVRKHEPRNPRALFSLGFHALQRGDMAAAVQLLTEACQEAPGDLLARMTLVAAHRATGDSDAERVAIEAALAVDAYCLPALLAKAGWFDRHGSRATAATTYRHCLQIAPPSTHWPVGLRPQLERARDVVAHYCSAYDEFLTEKIVKLHSALSGLAAERWREAVSIMSGKTKPYNVDCNQLHVPRLPALCFYDSTYFPWKTQLEAQTGVIREELEAALQADRDKFSPYIGYNPGEPVNQWGELNHSDRWSVLALWRGGERVEENVQRCPQTALALEQVDKAEIGGLCPNAMFSALAPHTHIPPHHGETNARLVAHLPLIVPEKCSFRAGFEVREWTVGEVFAFDDTLEHEARNDSDELRVVLIFDVWNPLLVPAEREMVKAMTAAAREFSAVYHPES